MQIKKKIETGRLKIQTSHAKITSISYPRILEPPKKKKPNSKKKTKLKTWLIDPEGERNLTSF